MKDRFQSIFDKWSDHPTPSEARELVKYASGPTKTLAFDYIETLRQSGTYDDDEVSSEIQNFAIALGTTIWSCYYIGLEYSSQGDSDAPSTNPLQSDQVQITLDFEEWYVLDACIEAVRQQLLRKSTVAQQSLSRQETDVVSRIEDLQSIIKSAGMSATEHLSEEKLNTRLENAMAFNHLLVSTFRSIEEAINDWRQGR